jgi:hypothetical protein
MNAAAGESQRNAELKSCLHRSIPLIRDADPAGFDRAPTRHRKGAGGEAREVMCLENPAETAASGA